MRRRVITGNTLPQYRRYARNAPKYKCAGGCGGSVDRPDSECFQCTVDWLYGEDADTNWLDDEPTEAA